MPLSSHRRRKRCRGHSGRRCCGGCHAACWRGAQWPNALRGRANAASPAPRCESAASFRSPKASSAPMSGHVAIAIHIGAGKPDRAASRHAPQGAPAAEVEDRIRTRCAAPVTKRRCRTERHGHRADLRRRRDSGADNRATLRKSAAAATVICAEPVKVVPRIAVTDYPRRDDGDRRAGFGRARLQHKPFSHIRSACQ